MTHINLENDKEKNIGKKIWTPHLLGEWEKKSARLLPKRPLSTKMHLSVLKTRVQIC